MALTQAQAARVQYCYETLEDVENMLRPVDRDAANALKRSRKELENYARASGINHQDISGVTATGITAAASLPRRGRISK